MSKLFYIIGLIVSGLAFLYWFDCENLDACEGFGLFAQHAGETDSPPIPSYPGFTVKDGNQSVVSLKDHFRFPKSNALPLSPVELQKAIGDMKKHIQEHPNRQLEVVGYYNDQEGKPSNAKFANWGLARADQLKQQLVNAGIPANLIVPTAKKDNSLMFEKDTLYGGLEASYKSRAINPLVIKDADNPVAQSSKNLWFLNPKSDNNNVNDFDKEFQQIADYLKKNPNREITISGTYKDDTTKKMGEDRANIIKTKLIAMGISPDKIDVIARKEPYLHTSNDTIYSPIDFLFKVSEAKAKDLLANKRPLRFNSNSADLLLSKELQEYLNDVKTFLLQDASKNVVLTGHTDSDGKDAINMTLGKKRADDVKVRLVNMGIAVDRISTTSKGETDPIATNSTKAGKAQNRRVEVSVQ